MEFETQQPRVDLLVGDCIDRMRHLPDQSINTCVTSPPYFGLRDYGVDGQIGLEETPDAFVQRLVEVFREVRRVLRDDGTLWVNLGDSYVSHKPRSGSQHAQSQKIGDQTAAFSAARKAQDLRGKNGFKDKDLIGTPWMFAFAMRQSGWYLRQDIIWHKSNPMPESVTDRCTKSHEHIFLFSKSPSYYFDHGAIQEDAKTTSGKRNKRDVWSIPVRPFKGAHFATFPPDLIEPCVLAGAPIGGTVLDPFGGSGTTAGVAVKHGRNAVLCELNPDYADLIPDRIRSIAGDAFCIRKPAMRPVANNDNLAEGCSVWEAMLRRVLC